MANRNLNKWLAERKAEIVEQVEEGKELKGLADLPVGLYIAVYIQHEVKESKQEKYGLLSEWLVLEGEFTGESIYNWTDLEREDAFKWLTLSLKNAGVEIDDPEELVSQMQTSPEDFFGLVDKRRVVKVRVKKTKGKDGNEYINKQVEKALLDYEVDQEFIDKILEDRKNKKAAKSEDEDASEPDEIEDTETEETESEDEGNEISDEVHVGSKITFLQGRKTLSGVVKEVNEDDGTVVVTKPDGNEVEIGVDSIQNIDNSGTQKV